MWCVHVGVVVRTVLTTQSMTAVTLYENGRLGDSPNLLASGLPSLDGRHLGPLGGKRVCARLSS